MRISIWQQFSSNNSSDFTVVGEFASSQLALTAVAEISRLLRELGEWYEQPENRAALDSIRPPRRGVNQPLTPIEIEFSQKYQIDWGQAIDWMRQSAWERDAIIAMDRFVVISNLSVAYSWMGCHPIDNLIERLGGKAVCDSDRDGGYLVAVITATAPSPAIAAQLCDGISAYLSFSDSFREDWLPVPWLNYWKAELAIPEVAPDNLTALEAAYLGRERQSAEFHESSKELMETLLTEANLADKSGEHEKAAELRQQWADVETKALEKLPPLSPEDEAYVLQAIQQARAIGEIHRYDSQLIFSLRADPTDHNLFAVMQYLKVNGCTNVEFKIEQHWDHPQIRSFTTQLPQGRVVTSNYKLSP